jgi:hypothetical protein
MVSNNSARTLAPSITASFPTAVTISANRLVFISATSFLRFRFLFESDDEQYEVDCEADCCGANS